MPKRTSKPRRKVPRLTAEEKYFFERLDASGDSFSMENALKLYAIANTQADIVEQILSIADEDDAQKWPEGNMTRGPERTPLKAWTAAQVDAYKKQRLADVQGSDLDMQELP